VKALVLSGGGHKGAFQAGAIKAIAQTKFTPDLITGSSVGALNLLHLLNTITSEHNLGVNSRLLGPAVELYDFWEKKIQGPHNILKKNSKWVMAAGLFADNWPGFFSMDPLKKLMMDQITSDLHHSPIKAAVGTVNVDTGQIEYHDNSEPNFLDYAFASAMQPVVMPTSWIKGKPYVDGGVRDIAPLSYAINAGATEIIIISCQSPAPKTMRWKGDVITLLSRTLDIMVHEVIENDIAECERRNSLIPWSGDSPGGYDNNDDKLINLTVIRPSLPYKHNIDSFMSSDVLNMLAEGYVEGKKAMNVIK